MIHYWRFTTRTEQLTKCCEPLQILRVRIGTCKIDLSPPVILYYGSFQGDTSVVVLIVLCLGVIFVLFAPSFCFDCTLCTFSNLS